MANSPRRFQVIRRIGKSGRGYSIWAPRGMVEVLGWKKSDAVYVKLVREGLLISKVKSREEYLDEVRSSANGLDG